MLLDSEVSGALVIKFFSCLSLLSYVLMLLSSSFRVCPH